MNTYIDIGNLKDCDLHVSFRDGKYTVVLKATDGSGNFWDDVSSDFLTAFNNAVGHRTDHENSLKFDKYMRIFYPLYSDAFYRPVDIIRDEFLNIFLAAMRASGGDEEASAYVVAVYINETQKAQSEAKVYDEHKLLNNIQHHLANFKYRAERLGRTFEG